MQSFRNDNLIFVTRSLGTRYDSFREVVASFVVQILTWNPAGELRVTGIVNEINGP